MNNVVKVPKQVAAAIAYFVDLADTKTEALTDILSMGYEGGRSETILRHFDGNHDELMQALICGYEVELSPEDNVQAYYVNLQSYSYNEYNQGIADGVIDTLNLLGIEIAGVNA